MTNDKKLKCRRRSKRKRKKNNAKLDVKYKGLENAKKMGNKMREIAKEYPALWLEKGHIRYNTVYGNKMRFHIKQCVMSVECHKDKRWKRISSYSLCKMDLDQWRNALEYISTIYA